MVLRNRITNIVSNTYSTSNEFERTEKNRNNEPKFRERVFQQNKGMKRLYPPHVWSDMYIPLVSRKPQTRCIGEPGKAIDKTVPTVETKATAPPVLMVYNTKLPMIESLFLDPLRRERKRTEKITTNRVSDNVVIEYVAIVIPIDTIDLSMCLFSANSMVFPTNHKHPARY